MKQEIVQVSFEQGMIENIKQSSFVDNGQFQSALWICNYDYDTEKLSLVKRNGLFPIKIQQNTSINFYFADRQSNIIDFNIFIQGFREVTDVGLLKTLQPLYNNTYYVIAQNLLDDTQNTGAATAPILRIISYCIIRNLQNNIVGPLWHNSIINNINRVIGVGDEIYGFYSDKARYGETLLIATAFTTELARLHGVLEPFIPILWQNYPLFESKLKPVRIFRFYDFWDSYRENKIYKGVVIPNLQEKDLQEWKSDSDINIKVEVKNLWEILPSTNLSNPHFNVFNYDINSDILIGIEPDVIVTTQSNDTKNTINRKNIYHYETTQYEDKAPQYISLNNTTYEHSLFIPEYSSYNKLINHICNTREIAWYKTDDKPGDPPSSNLVVEPLTIGRINVISSDKVELNITDLSGRVLKTGFCNSNDAEFTGIKYQRQNEQPRSHGMVIPHYIVNYKKHKIPRPWVEEEKIPIAITAIVDGVEVLIDIQEYIVPPAIRQIRDWRPANYEKDYEYLRHLWTNFGIRNNQNHFITIGIEHSFATGGLITNYESEQITHHSWIYGWVWAEKFSRLEPSKFTGNVDIQRVPEYEIDDDNIYTSNKGKVCDTFDKVGLIWSPYFSYRRDINGDYRYLYIRSLLKLHLFIKPTSIYKLLGYGISAINVYISGKNYESSYIEILNLINPAKSPRGMYCKPSISNIDKNKLENYDLSKFRLFKSYIINGDGEENVIDYSLYNETKAARINAWAKIEHWGKNSITGMVEKRPFIKAVGVYDQNVNDPTLRGRPVQPVQVISDGRVYTTILDSTPDDVIWDYSDGPPLALNGSGVYWKGKGARLVEVIQGRTFIAGCYDEHNKEEIGRVRYSVNIGGVSSLNLFYKEDYLIIGHLPIVAMTMFREQAIWFNRREFYRIVFPNIADVTTWEFADAEVGQGTFNQKTVVSTPQGVIFANENGVWITDGGKAISLTNNSKTASSIEGIYQYIATANNNINMNIIRPGIPFIDPVENYNTFLELEYNSKTDEVIISTPMYEFSNTEKTKFDFTLQLIYSLKDMRWKVYKFQYPRVDNQVVNLIQHNKVGKYMISDSGEIYYATTSESDNGSEELDVQIQRIDNRFYQDYYFNFNTPSMPISLPISSLYTENVYGEIITHEIGNGMDDFILDKITLDNTTQERNIVQINPGDINDDNRIIGPIIENGVYEYNNYDYTSSNLDNRDPIIAIELRNRDIDTNIRIDPYMRIINQPNVDITLNNSISPYIDITALNMQAKHLQLRNPYDSKLKTPYNSQDTFNETFNNQQTSAYNRESLVLTAPRGKYRRARYLIKSRLMNKIKSLRIRTIKLKRRQI